MSIFSQVMVEIGNIEKRQKQIIGDIADLTKIVEEGSEKQVDVFTRLLRGQDMLFRSTAAMLNVISNGDPLERDENDKGTH